MTKYFNKQYSSIFQIENDLISFLSSVIITHDATDPVNQKAQQCRQAIQQKLIQIRQVGENFPSQFSLLQC